MPPLFARPPVHCRRAAVISLRAARSSSGALLADAMIFRLRHARHAAPLPAARHAAMPAAAAAAAA